MLRVDAHRGPDSVDRRDADLLAALREASGDPDLSLDGPPVPINLRATVLAVRLRSAVAGLTGAGVLRFCDSQATATRQVTISRYLTAQGYPAAEVLLAGSPADALGGAWLLTELVPERPRPARRFGRLSAVLPALGALWRRPAMLADLNAGLHAIGPGPVQRELSASGAGLDWFGFLYDRARMVRGRQADQVLGWLERNRPASPVLVISHGDLHHENVVAGPGIRRVIDWEIAGLAPPARDIACTMLTLSMTGCRAPRLFRPVTAALGRALSGRFLRLYRARSAVAPSDRELAWHRVLCSLTRLYWARTESDEAGSDNPAVVAESAARGREASVHARIIRDITGIDLTDFVLQPGTGPWADPPGAACGSAGGAVSRLQPAGAWESLTSATQLSSPAAREEESATSVSP